MRINNNIMAMNTHRQYGINNANVAKSIEKLSSGYRINRAGDDAAGLAISEKMRAQIRGLQMASKNSQDAISLVQTAEGALQETHNILQRMRELAVQSASDTNETTIDRDALNKEFQALIEEIDDTANKAKFNDMGIIDGSFAAWKIAGAVTGGTTPDFTVNIDALALASDGSTPTSAGFTLDWKGATDTPADPTYVPASATITVSATEKYTLFAGQTKLQLANGVSIDFTEAIADDFSNLDDIFGVTAPAASGATVTQAYSIAFTMTEGAEFTVQTGANKGDELNINIDRMDSTTLGVWGSNISLREYASNAIKEVDTAVNKVSTQRAALGALQNRLEHKIANLDTSAENLQAAESRIRDLDMAKEMTAFTKNNILSQAATAMLAQANTLPQGVLQLLQ